MTLLQHVVSCKRIKTKEQKKSDMTYISQKCITKLHLSVYVMILEFIYRSLQQNSLAFEN